MYFAKLLVSKKNRPKRESGMEGGRAGGREGGRELREFWSRSFVSQGLKIS